MRGRAVFRTDWYDVVLARRLGAGISLTQECTTWRAVGGDIPAARFVPGVWVGAWVGGVFIVLWSEVEFRK